MTTNTTIQHVIDLNRQRGAAMVADDHDALRRLLSDDLVYIHAGGTLDTKESFIAKRRPDGISYDVVEYSDVHPCVLSESAILLRGNCFITETFKDGRGTASVKLRFSSAWRKEADGNWRMVHSQSSKRTAPGGLKEGFL